MDKSEMYQALKDIVHDVDFNPNSRLKGHTFCMVSDRHLNIARNVCKQYEHEWASAEEKQATANVLAGFPPE